MLKLVSAAGEFGPFTAIETLGDRYLCDGVEYPFTVVGEATTDTYTAPPPDPQTLVDAKAAKILQINQWRAAANKTFFTYSGKQVACDDLSRSDIDAVAGSISLTGAFPAGFPGAWKAMDNSYIMLPDIAAFKSLYAAMTAQGTTNFGHSQSLKAAVAAAQTVAEVNAVVW